MNTPRPLRSRPPSPRVRLTYVAGSLVLAATVAATVAATTTATDEIVSDGRVVAILADGVIELPWSEVVLWTGERFPGALATSLERSMLEEEVRVEVPDEMLLWRHASLGVMAFPFEWVRAIHLTPTAVASGTGASADGSDGSGGARSEDVVVLTNGDRVKGVVTAIGERIIVDMVGDQPFRRALESTDVESVWLVGSPSSAGSPRHWLADGTIVDAAAPGAITRSWQRKLDDAVAGSSALLDARRVQPLAESIQSVSAVDGVLPAAAAPTYDVESIDRPNRDPLRAGEIRMDAPSRVEGVMPFTVGVLHCRVFAESPRASGSLVVLQEGQVVTEVSVVGASHASSTAVSPAASPWRDPRRGITLEVRLARGAFAIEFREEDDGPIGDRVVLRDGLVIDATPVDPSDAQSAQPRLTGRRTASPTG